MKQMHVAENQKVDFNYDNADVPEMVKILRPLVYKEGNTFSCLLGPDLKTGIYGGGNTAEEAVRKWAEILEKRIVACDLDEQTAHHIREALNAIN